MYEIAYLYSTGRRTRTLIRRKRHRASLSTKPYFGFVDEKKKYSDGYTSYTCCRTRLEYGTEDDVWSPASDRAVVDGRGTLNVENKIERLNTPSVLLITDLKPLDLNRGRVHPAGRKRRKIDVAPEWNFPRANQRQRKLRRRPSPTRFSFEYYGKFQLEWEPLVE